MGPFRTIVQGASRWLCYATMVLLIPMMLLTTAEVLGRALWNKPIPGSVEMSSYLLALFILGGLAYTQQVKGHVRVTMLTEWLPARVRASLDILTTLLSLFIVGILAWQGWEVASEERTVSDMLRVPQWPFRMLVPVAAVLLFLELALDLADSIKKLKEG